MSLSYNGRREGNGTGIFGKMESEGRRHTTLAITRGGWKPPLRRKTLHRHAPANPFLPRNPLAKSLGDDHAAVGFLVVFQNGDKGTAHGDSSAVEGVDKAGALVLGTLEADAQAAGLKVGAVGSAGDFAIFAGLAAGGHPGFQVELAIGGAAEVARAGVDDVIGKAQALEDRLLDGEQFLVDPVRLVGRAEDEHLDFRELVDAEQAARVAAGSAGLRAEAVRQADVLDR